MYKIGRGHWAEVTKVGRGHHLVNFYEWSELEKVTGASNVNRRGRDKKSGPMSLGRDHQSGPRSYVSKNSTQESGNINLFLGLSRIIGSLDRKINDVIAAIFINDDRQNRFKAAFSNILDLN